MQGSWCPLGRSLEESVFGRGVCAGFNKGEPSALGEAAVPFLWSHVSLGPQSAQCGPGAGVLKPGGEEWRRVVACMGVWVPAHSQIPVRVVLDNALASSWGWAGKRGQPCPSHIVVGVELSRARAEV